jgi:serpin B
MNYFLPAVSVVLAFGVWGLGVSANPADVGEPQALVRGNNDFAFDLYQRLRGQAGNLFLSPYSISTALTMTYAGAKGETAQEMAKVLHLPADQAKLNAEMAGLQEELTKKTKGIRLSVANALWGQLGQPFVPDFLAATKTYYNAGLHEVNFHDAEAARKEINLWVEKQTEQKIRDLLGSGTITPNTSLVLTNAIYFKGDWSLTFPKAATRKEDFAVSQDKKTPVDMMHLTEKFGYFEDDGFQALALPYQGDAVSLVAFLPKATLSLAKLEESMTAAKLDACIPALKKVKVIVSLPKFKMTASFQLADVLAKMGMPTLFAPGKADLSGIIASRDLFISQVVHKAFVDLNEEGTEAAAATAVIGVRASAVRPTPTPTFRADHPFLFVIRDNRTGSILFLGRVQNPNA